MTQKTLCLLARRHLGQASLGEFVDWAVFMLEAGYDSEHLRMLASLGPAPVVADITYHFGQTLDELNWIVPPIPVLLRQYARDIAQDVLEGVLLPEDGCHQLYRIYRDLDYPEDMQTWLYLDDNLEPGTYEELEGDNWDLAIRQEAWKFLQRVGL